MTPPPSVRTLVAVSLALAGWLAGPTVASAGDGGDPAGDSEGEQGDRDEEGADREGDPGPADPQPAPPVDPPPAATSSSTGTSLSAEDLAAIGAAIGPPPAAEPPPSAAPTPGAVVQALLPDIAIIADFALAAFSSDEPLQTGGHDPTANGFNLQQVELSVGKSVDPYFRLDSNIVFSLFGVEVEEVYATTLALPAGLQVRLGQFLTRFGRQNATHPHSWDFADQPIALGRVFGAEGNRGLGAEVSVLLPLPWYVEVLGSLTGAAGEASARSFYGGEDLGVDGPDDLQTTVTVKQFFPLSDDWSLNLGLAYAGGPNPTGRSNRSEVYGVDLYVKFRPITRGGRSEIALQSEWFYRRRQVPGDVLWDLTGYASLVWRWTRHLGGGLRYEYGSPARGLDASVADDPLDPEWDASRQRVSLQGTAWPTEFSRIRLQGAMDFPRWREGPDWSAFLAFEFLIGAHGAHKF